MTYIRGLLSDIWGLLSFLICPWYDILQFIDEWERMKNERQANQALVDAAVQRATEKAKMQKAFAGPLPKMRRPVRRPWWKFWK